MDSDTDSKVTVDLVAAQQTFTKHWGFPNYRPAQKEVIEAALRHEDVFAVLATGYGKSACFQLPALMHEGCALVISPLIALMKDQAEDCVMRGIPASFINSHINSAVQEERIEAWLNGEYKLLYVSPERLGMVTFRNAIKRANLNYLVVDECHCASMWGHDFRPDYNRIHEVLEMLESVGKRPTVIAVTATATSDIETDITRAIGMSRDYVKVVGDPVRPNLTYEVNPCVGTSVWGVVSSLAENFDLTQRHVIYAVSRRLADETGERLSQMFGGSEGATAMVYHAGLSATERTRVQEAFKTGACPIVVATCAFGMGIDVPNIRTVVHIGIPSSIEDYTQQTGRAGRDGLPSRCVLLLSEKAEATQVFFLNIANPPVQMYAPVWEFLLRHATSQTLKMTVKKMSQAINDNSGSAWSLTEETLSTILNVLVSHKLIVRKYLQAKTPIEIDPDLVARAIADTTRFTPTQRWILKLLLSKVKHASANTIFVSLSDLANNLAIKEDKLVTELETLKTRGLLIVGSLYSGKSTEVLTPHAELDLVLPFELLREKRRRAQLRLDAMIDYYSSSDLRGYLRNYFMD